MIFLHIILFSYLHYLCLLCWIRWPIIPNYDLYNYSSVYKNLFKTSLHYREI